MKKIENINPIINEYYLVPCIETINCGNITHITPVINHPHNDKENGQNHIHYHVDTRFIPVLLKNGKKYNSKIRIRNGEIIYYFLKCKNNIYNLITNKSDIKNSKLKHKCIYKGKCPHRGIDLTHISPIKGIITCPLHGLEFDAITKKLI